MKTVFVTVGTTCFDDLILSLISDEVTEALIQRGYTDVVLQVGQGSSVPQAHRRPGLRLEAFRFKESIAENIQSANLVISHAGAGSCLEVLGAAKPLLVVINDKLMDNHQLELAKQLQADGHLFYCTCSTLAETLRDMDLSTLLPFQRAAIILPGCLLFLFQGCWSRSHLSPNAYVSCISSDSISCLIINLEYVECNWTKPQMQQINYNFSSMFAHNPSRGCPEYVWEHGQRVGCRILLEEQTQRFEPFRTKLSVGGNQSLCRNYTDLKQRVKLNPPFNLSVNSSGRDGEVCVRWRSNTNIKKDCVSYMVRYRKASGLWKSSSSDCVSPLSSGVVYTFQVRSRMSDVCGASMFWSDWSDPAQWNDNKDVMTTTRSWMSWHVLGSVLGGVVLIVLSLLLCFNERVKVVFIPVVPDPSKSLQDLFKKHNGNVESWVYISRELKDAFEPDYTEAPCVVCDPSPTSEAKTEAGPKEQPVY